MEAVLSFQLPLFTIFMFLPPLFRMTFRMVSEKETRVRESMNMMGLTDFSYWVSWFLYYSLINLFISVASTIILGTWLLKNSDIRQVFLYFWMYGNSLFGFIIFSQSFFFKARNAAIFTSVMYISLSFVYLSVESSDSPEETKMLASLLPPVAC